MFPGKKVEENKKRKPSVHTCRTPHPLTVGVVPEDQDAVVIGCVLLTCHGLHNVVCFIPSFFKMFLCGHRAGGVVAQEHFKMGLLDCFITEVAQQ